MVLPLSRADAPLAPSYAAAHAAGVHTRRHAAVLRALTMLAVVLCLSVVVLGAYVRLSNAGLGCPDWPGCYGHMSPLGAAAAASSEAMPASIAGARPLQMGKAWREMVHRYAAGTLAALLTAIAVLGFLWRQERIVSPRYLAALVGIVVAQALLGMLTVTRQLTPIIVTLHLLLGLTTLSLLWWLALTLWQRRGLGAFFRSREVGWLAPAYAPARHARSLAGLGLVLLGVQIALGGWTSSNYAAIACPDFPTCQASWWPSADFHSAFVLWRDQNIDYEGGILTGPARIAIHLTHRIGATAATLALVAAALFCLRQRLPGSVRRAAAAVLLLLALQLAIGIEMVLRGFPLWLATAHNAGAALLLLSVVALNRQLRPATPLAL